MTPPPFKERFVFELCLGEMSSKVPQLRETLTRRDANTVLGLARDLRKTVGLLGLPKLFQLSQDIEYGCAENDPGEWLKQSDRFCNLIERIHFSIREQLEKN